MARKGKIGLDYFSHDVNMMGDNKIRFIKAKHGLLGYAVFLRLLEEIYKEKGYYLENGEKFNILFSDDNKLELNVFIEILNDCINEELFDSELHKKYNVLTSKRIQLNYLAAAERRQNITFIKEYLLVDIEQYKQENEKKATFNANIITLNEYINKENVNSGTQRKEKEKEKEKEKKINNNVAEEIYNFYKESLKAGKKQPSINNITRWLNDFDKNELIKSIINYKNSKDDTTDKTYIKTCSNFFGVKDESNGFFKDYLKEIPVNDNLSELDKLKKENPDYYVSDKGNNIYMMYPRDETQDKIIIKDGVKSVYRGESY